jgi:hypothetical protein
MKDKPLISMIIPTHNRAELLQEALDSVYAQEDVGEQFEMEIIVIDDASSDATPDIMHRNPGVRFIRLETNLGASAARNVGIRASKGKYVAFLDDDDLCLSHRLKMHVSVLETHPEVGVVYGQQISTGEGKPFLWPDATRAPSGSTFHALLMEEFILTNCVMVRREAFETAGYFDENLGTMEHYDMFVRLAFHVPFAFVPGAVAVGRFSEQGKWFTNIKKGGYEKTVPFIVGRALAKLPDNAETAELGRKVRLSWIMQITYWLQKAGQTDRMRSHVLTALQTNPWMVTEEWASWSTVSSLSTVARALAFASESPIGAVRAFCADAEATTKGLGPHVWRKMRRLLAPVWLAVANALVETRLPQYRRSSAYLTAYAILYNHALLRRKDVWMTLVRGTILASPRWDPILAVLKRQTR